MKNLKQIICIISFASAILIGFIALFLPPEGIIDASVLWFVAQLLCFVATLLGANLSIDFLNRKVDTSVKTKEKVTD